MQIMLLVLSNDQNFDLAISSVAYVCIGVTVDLEYLVYHRSRAWLAQGEDKASRGSMGVKQVR